MRFRFLLYLVACSLFVVPLFAEAKEQTVYESKPDSRSGIPAWPDRLSCLAPQQVTLLNSCLKQNMSQLGLDSFEVVENQTEQSVLTKICKASASGQPTHAVGVTAGGKKCAEMKLPLCECPNPQNRPTDALCELGNDISGLVKTTCLHPSQLSFVKEMGGTAKYDAKQQQYAITIFTNKDSCKNLGGKSHGDSLCTFLVDECLCNGPTAGGPSDGLTPADPTGGDDDTPTDPTSPAGNDSSGPSDELPSNPDDLRPTFETTTGPAGGATTGGAAGGTPTSTRSQQQDNLGDVNCYCESGWNHAVCTGIGTIELSETCPDGYWNPKDPAYVKAAVLIDEYNQGKTNLDSLQKNLSQPLNDIVRSWKNGTAAKKVNVYALAITQNHWLRSSEEKLPLHPLTPDQVSVNEQAGTSGEPYWTITIGDVSIDIGQEPPSSDSTNQAPANNHSSNDHDSNQSPRNGEGTQENSDEYQTAGAVWALATDEIVEDRTTVTITPLMLVRSTGGQSCTLMPQASSAHKATWIYLIVALGALSLFRRRKRPAELHNIKIPQRPHTEL